MGISGNMMIAMKKIYFYEPRPFFAELWEKAFASGAYHQEIKIIASFLDVQTIGFELIILAFFDAHVPVIQEQVYPKLKSRVHRWIVVGETLAPYPYEWICVGADRALREFYLACGLNLEPVRPHAPMDKLSPKESGVVRLTATGMSMKEIACEMNISVSTVQTYRQRAMEKMRVSSLTELIVASAALGLRGCPCRQSQVFRDTEQS